MSRDTEARASSPERHAQALRLELKQWEKSFAEANGGRKAERSDIKKDPTIAKKYKEYDRLRTRRSSNNPFSQAPATPSYDASKKRKRNGLEDARPASSQSHRTLTKQVESPVSQRPATTQAPHPNAIDPYDAPHSVHTTPTAIRTSIGPTPQRNGYSLGLFDLLSPSESPLSAAKAPDAAAPSPARASDLEATLCNRARTMTRPAATLLTPRKKAVLATPAKASATPARHTRTPPSSGRRNYLNAFLMTPTTQRLRPGINVRSVGLVRRVRGDEDLECVATPSRRPSEAMRGAATFGTPGKDTGGKENRVEAEEPAPPSMSFSPIAVRMPPKPVGQPLSALVRGLREMEEERMDEEMDILREMEAEWEAGTVAPPKPDAGAEGREHSTGDAGHGQVTETAGENGKTEEQQAPTRVWKKKGQRRTTRNVKIQPSTAKWKPEPEWKGGMETDDDAEADRADEAPNNPDFSITSEHLETSGPSESKEHGKQDKKGRGRPPKKISATAHPNFRALKIKNRKSKAKGRFGRRR